jgi:hypothetical protein
MDTDNPFDRKLDRWKDRIPADVRDAAVFVVDTLDLCMAAAESVFGQSNPQMALEIYDRIVRRMASTESDSIVDE